MNLNTPPIPKFLFLFFAFQSADCTGTCYLAANDVNVSPLKNAIFYTGTNWVQSTGAEVDAGSKVYDSYYYKGICIANNASFDYSYPIDKPYTLPTGLSFPLQTPLYYDSTANH